MKCRQFVSALEDHLARHPDQRAAVLPAALSSHASMCRGCYHDLKLAFVSRQLLLALRPTVEPAPDPHFATRLRARIEARQAARPASWRSWQVAGREFAVALVLFVATLSTFVYNLHRTEAKNADEAMVVDVPHLNAQHPADDHLRPRLSDVMVSLLNP